jgi:hypothetical protein
VSARNVTMAMLRALPIGRSEHSVSLLCLECGGQYSACAGDYWHLHASHVFTCCNRPMRLVRKVVRYVEVGP